MTLDILVLYIWALVDERVIHHIIKPWILCFVVSSKYVNTFIILFSLLMSNCIMSLILGFIGWMEVNIVMYWLGVVPWLVMLHKSMWHQGVPAKDTSGWTQCQTIMTVSWQHKIHGDNVPYDDHERYSLMYYFKFYSFFKLIYHM